MKKNQVFAILLSGVMAFGLAACGQKPQEVPEAVAESSVSEEPAAKTFSVRFEDGDGGVLATQEVEEGKAAKAPVDPEREGFVFAGWDKDFSKITSDTVIQATWEAEILALTADTSHDVDEDGNLVHPLLTVEVRKKDGSAFAKDDAIKVSYILPEEMNVGEIVGDAESKDEAKLGLRIEGLEKYDDEYILKVCGDDLSFLDGSVLYQRDDEKWEASEYELELAPREEVAADEAASSESEETSSSSSAE